MGILPTSWNQRISGHSPYVVDSEAMTEFERAVAEAEAWGARVREMLDRAKSELDSRE